jgi:outer membrane receptor for ferric coprogen and ferric-rhodotorulic acid
MIGASTSKSTNIFFINGYDNTSTPAYGFTPAFPYASDATPKPLWAERNKYADLDVTLTRLFGSTKLNITDSLFVIAGFNAIDYSRKGHNVAERVIMLVVLLIMKKTRLALTSPQSMLLPTILMPT